MGEVVAFKRPADDKSPVDIDATELKTWLISKMNGETSSEKRAACDNWFVKNGFTGVIKDYFYTQLESACLDNQAIFNKMFSVDSPTITFDLTAQYEITADGQYFTWPSFTLYFDYSFGGGITFKQSIYVFDLQDSKKYDRVKNICFHHDLPDIFITEKGFETLGRKLSNSAFLESSGDKDWLEVRAIKELAKDDWFYYATEMVLILENCGCVCEIEEVEVK